MQFHDPSPELLRGLVDTEWDQLLAFSDRAHLTLIFGKGCWDYLPHRVRERIGHNYADNGARLERLQETYREIACALARARAQHLVLKGFSQWPDFVGDIRQRMQSDLDLYCPEGLHFRARDALRQMGYEDVASPENNVGDHIPPLLRRTGWQWSGNAFDPEMPPSIELHYRLWNASSTRIGPFDFGGFSSRRIEREIGSVRFTALHPVDRFTYSALHALRHLLLGGLLPSHIYELAFFLHHNRHNEPLWKGWLSWHEDALRSVAAVPCLLAAQWFGCQLPGIVDEEIRHLPETVPRWFRAFAYSPLAALFHRNKDALWLHLALIDSAREKCFILSRQLFPLWVPPLRSRWVQERVGKSSTEQQKRIQAFFTYLYWFISRSLAHLRVVPLTLWNGLRLWSS
jgi:hypothetical protein